MGMLGDSGPPGPPGEPSTRPHPAAGHRLPRATFLHLSFPPQAPRDHRATGRWVRRAPWASRASPVSPAPRGLRDHRAKPGTAAPPSAWAPCPWSSPFSNPKMPRVPSAEPVPGAAGFILAPVFQGAAALPGGLGGLRGLWGGCGVAVGRVDPARMKYSRVLPHAWLLSWCVCCVPVSLCPRPRVPIHVLVPIPVPIPVHGAEARALLPS